MHPTHTLLNLYQGLIDDGQAMGYFNTLHLHVRLIAAREMSGPSDKSLRTPSMTSYPSLIPEQPLTRLDNLQYRLDFTTDTFAIVPLVYRTSPMSLPPHQASTSILHIRPPHQSSTSGLHINPPHQASTSILHIRPPRQSSTSVLHINPPCRCLHVSPPRLLGVGSMEICRYIRDHLFASNSSDLRLLLSPPRS